MTQPDDARPAVRPPAHRDGHAVHAPTARSTSTAPPRWPTYLVDEQRNDGLVINGTTGESPTTTDAEKEPLLRAVVEAVGDRAAGRRRRRHQRHRAHHRAGPARPRRPARTACCVVTPYYNKPPQAGLLRALHRGRRRHRPAGRCSTTSRDRTGVAIATETLCRLAEHPRIVAVKDAKGDLAASAWVLRRHRPRVLLRRRRAHPAAARRSARSAWSARSTHLIGAADQAR